MSHTLEAYNDENCPFTFGEFLRILRTGKDPITNEKVPEYQELMCSAKRISQTELGAYIGKNKNWVSRIELGEQSIIGEENTFLLVLKITQALGCGRKALAMLDWAAQCDIVRSKGHTHIVSSGILKEMRSLAWIKRSRK